MKFFPHVECGCSKAPIVGARYRKRARDILTGSLGDYRFYEVVSVEPFRQDRIFCRRVTLREEGGWIGHLFVQVIFEQYEAVENVVPLMSTKRRSDNMSDAMC